jgi:hypothetical protein
VRGLDVVREIRFSVYAAVVMAVIMYCARTYSPESLVSLLVQGVCAVVVYLGVYALIDRGRLFGELRTLAQ